MNDLRMAFRALAKTPVVAGVAILSLALGIGANTAIFSLLDQILLRSLPVSNPHELVNLTANGPRSGSNSTNSTGGMQSIFSYPMFRDLEKKQEVFTGIAAHRSFSANLAFKGSTASGDGMLVSGSYFPVLQLRPALGRLLSPEDDRTAGAHRVVVLSHSFWTRRFHQDPAVLNEALIVNGVPMTIAGVAPQSFISTTFGSQPDIFVPISMGEEVRPGWKGLENRRNYWVYLFARLKPAMPLEQAQAGMNVLYRSIIHDVDLPLQKGASARMLQQFRDQTMQLNPGNQGQSNMQGQARTPLLLLLATTGFVLLIACANIANLLLARAANRAKEMSVRLAIGASRFRLIRQLLTEAMVIAVAGGVAGLFCAYATSQLLLSFLPQGRAPIQTDIDGRALLFAMGVAIATGLLFGIFPAIYSTKTDLVSALKDQAAQASASGAAARFRRMLVTAQIAISLILLISAGLFLKSMVNISRVDLGLRTHNVVQFSVSPELNKYTPEKSRDFFQRMEGAVTAIPGVSSVAASRVPLISGSNWGSNISIDGFAAGPDTDTHSMYNHIGPGFFRTMGVALRAGREFAESDSANTPKVAVVNEAFVRKFSASSSALGKHMQMGSGGKNDIEIVGIVTDAKYSQVKDATPPVVYLPYRQDLSSGSSYFYVLTALPPEQTLSSIRRVAAELDPNLPLDNLKTLEAQVQENVFLDRMISTLAATFAALATLLAAVGLYGVLAYTVVRRTREIGIRLAMGATEATVRNMVLREVAVLLAAGVVIAVPAALGLARYVESLLYQLKGYDVTVMACAVAAIGLVAMAAGYFPARRAMRVNPVQALRNE